MTRRGYRGAVSANIHATRFTKYFAIADNQTRSASPTDTSITVSPATAIRRRLPPVRPMTFAGTLAAAARCSTAVTSSGATPITTRRRFAEKRGGDVHCVVAGHSHTIDLDL